MPKFKALYDRVYALFLSPQSRVKSERVILFLAIVSFIVHLLLIYFHHSFGIFNGSESKLLKNPIAAIYTPFSFILVYEIYLLVYYLPRSITTYISKQYEIITLIIIRRLFKDLANLELSSDWFSIKDDLQFTYDTITSLLLFFLIYQFTKNRKKLRPRKTSEALIPAFTIKRFVRVKKGIAILLVPILFVLALSTFFSWFYQVIQPSATYVSSFKDINNIFFDEFFTILIVVDVLLLLVSFFHTDQFHKVIRNSGFIISTILLRLSFSVDGILNNVLIIAAVSYGLIILFIHNSYESWLSKKEEIREDPAT